MITTTTVRQFASFIKLEEPECLTKESALQVTPHCIDPLYNKVIIDREVDVELPIPHHKVSGHFDGTNIDFNIYLPKTNYPQRPVYTAGRLSQGASGGGTHTGNITCKVIVLDTLLDYDAFPWHADWYRNKVKKSLGHRFGDNYKLYFADNADHQMGGVPKSLTNRLVDFTGIYEQHLRDLSAWVENGKEPAAQTVYSVKDGQVLVPKTAAERKALQAVIDLTADGKSEASIGMGHLITLKAHVELPPGVGLVTSVEWDFEGNGDFVKGGFEKGKTSMDVTASTKFNRGGVYYPAVRVGIHRDGNTELAYAQVLNLGRMRITVH
ncbi:hypothetical protein ACHAPO_011821 [Fusarium lateritium]